MANPSKSFCIGYKHRKRTTTKIFYIIKIHLEKLPLSVMIYAFTNKYSTMLFLFGLPLDRLRSLADSKGREGE